MDAPTCKNVVLARVVGSMTEFKQIIGRGTRVRDDYGKLWFNILDYTGSATRLFADPDFDGDPARLTEEEIDEDGEVEATVDDETSPTSRSRTTSRAPSRSSIEPPAGERRKFYFDGGQVEIAAHLVYELDPDGKQLRVVRYTDYAAEKVRTLCPTAPELRERVGRPGQARRDHRAPGGARHRLRRPGRGSAAARRRPVRPALPPRLQRPAAHPARAGAAAARRAQGLLRPVRPRGARRSWTSCSRSTPSTATRSSCCPTCCRCRPSRRTAT